MKDARTIARDYIALLASKRIFSMWSTGYESAHNSEESWTEENGMVIVEKRGTNEPIKIFVPIACRMHNGRRGNTGLYWHDGTWVNIGDGFSTLANHITEWTYSDGWSYSLVEAVI